MLAAWSMISAFVPDDGSACETTNGHRTGVGTAVPPVMGLPFRWGVTEQPGRRERRASNRDTLGMRRWRIAGESGGTSGTRCTLNGHKAVITGR